MKKIYSFIAVAVVAITAAFAAATVDSTEIVKMWNFSEWENATIAEPTTIDGLTIYALEGKTIVIDENKKPINGVEYTKRLKFGGKSDWNGNEPKDRVLAFDVQGPTVVEIGLTSSNTSGTGRFLTVYNGSKENPLGEGYEAPVSGAEACTFNYTGEEATTLLIGVDGGINIYYVKATTTIAEQGGEPGTGDGSDDDNIGLNDPTDEVTFDFTAETFDMTVLSGNTQEYNPDPTVIDYKDITLTLNGRTRLWQASSGTELRFYTASNFNVAAPEGFLISKIEMTGQTGNTNFSAEGYNNGTWEGEAPAQNVTIACIKGSGNAAIKTIKVTLVEDPAAQEELPEIDSFNPLSDAEDGAEFKVGMDVTVVLANEALSIVYDGVSYQGVIFGYPLSVKAGDVVKAGWNAMYESGVLFATSEITVDGTTALPEPTPIENVENIPNWQYVHFDNVIVPSNGVDDYYFPMCEAAFDEGSLSFMMENMLGLDITAGDYAVDGFWYVNYALDEDPVQSFIPTAVTPSAESIDNFVALADFEDGASFKFTKDVTVAFASEALVILYDGTSYQGAMLNGAAALKVGDVIKAGWTAVCEGNGIFFTSTYTVDGTAELPEAVPFEATMGLINWAYVNFKHVIVPEGVDGEYFFCNAIIGEDVASFNITDVLGIIPEAGEYAITGFWVLDEDEDGEIVPYLIPTEVAETLMTIDNFNALLGGDIEQGTEVEISCNATVALALPEMMMYLIYDGQNYYPLATEQEFTVGDIIAGGWNAYVIDTGVYTEETLDVIGKGEVPEPTHVEFADLAYTMSMPYQLITIEGVEMEEFTAGDDVIMVGEYLFMNAFDLSKDAGTYDVTGIWYEMMGTKVFIITSITENSTSINGIMIDANENAEYFNLNGVKVQNPTAGQVYIRVINGKATKVVK